MIETEFASKNTLPYDIMSVFHINQNEKGILIFVIACELEYVGNNWVYFCLGFSFECYPFRKSTVHVEV